MKRIAIIGPESTGKSTLCSQLAKHYLTAWCPEFARQYLSEKGTNYSYHDLLVIAQEQVAQEDLLQQSAKDLYFIDTEMYVMKIWCEVVFNNCHTWILKEIVSRQYDLYLLCATDLPWVADPLREYPDIQIRQRLFTMYRETLVSNGCKWAPIYGSYDLRLKTATALIDVIANPATGSR
ncbi:MAG: ATP-binding protein [Chitinophagaceae bacterium]